jgi:3-(3-hydroxy-phenyl)propionate hydroxylase
MLEKLLLEGTQRYPHVVVRFKCRLVALAQQTDGVELTLCNHDDAAISLRPKFVLACDGANSFVRRSLGIAAEGKRIDEPHLVVDFAEFPDQSPYSRFFCHPTRPFNSILVPYGGRRIEFMLNPGEDKENMKSPRVIRSLVNRHTPYKGFELKIVRAAVYGYSARIAERMQQGRIFLLGDAAHVMPPFGAQGLNSGARDAANLTWKIAAVLREQMGFRSLDSYDPERRPNIRDTVDYSVGVGRLANIRFWPAALLRDVILAVANLFPSVRRYFREMRYMPKPRIDAGLVVTCGRGEGSPVGRMFPRPLLVGEDRERVSIDKVIGAGFALVGVNVSRKAVTEAARHPVWANLRPALISISLEPKASPAAQTNNDYFLADDSAIPMLAVYDAQIVIVRPDRYVAGIGPPHEFTRISDAFARLLGQGD